MMTNGSMRACLNQEMIKISKLIQVKLRITHVRDRNLTEDRIYPKAEFDWMWPNAECSKVWIEHTTW